MSLDDWILALHVLSAFALVSGMVLFWIVIVAVRNVDTVGQTLAYGRVMGVGTPVVLAGVAGTILFGAWLAISLDRYQLWDGWIIGAIVLWAIGSEVGRRSGVEYRKALPRATELQAAGQEGASGELRALNRSPKGLLLHTVSTLAFVLILIDMIWKPGA